MDIGFRGFLLWSAALLSVARCACGAEAAAVGAREVVNVHLPVTPERFLTTFLLDDGFTKTIFDKNKDVDVKVGAWVKDGGWKGGAVVARRELEYRHPVKTSFPGMPSHAKTYKKQSYEHDHRRGVLDIREQLRFEGIPKADHFEVLTEWTVRSTQEGQKQRQPVSEVSIRLTVKFNKKTVLRRTIEKNTFSEQGDALWDWVSTARDLLLGGNSSIISKKRGDASRGRQLPHPGDDSVDTASGGVGGGGGASKIDWARVFLGRRFRGRRAKQQQQGGG